MPLSKEHKRQTRERIVRAAARAFRAEGVDGARIADLMRQAGLTHGGFYAHFPSKDALVAEACAAGLTESGAALYDAADAAPPGEGLRLIVRGYLSRTHRDHPETGCVIATLGPEIAREPAEVRHAFTAALKDDAARLASHLASHLSAEPGAGGVARDDAAYVLLAGMAGAMLMARAVDDPVLSDRILLAARRLYTHSFGEGGGADAAATPEGHAAPGGAGGE